MGSYQGNADKVIGDAKKIAERMRKGTATFNGLQREYHCGYYVIIRAILSQMSKRQWAEIRHAKLASWGIKTRFKKGMVTWNKGKKGWFPPGTEKTRFRKGHRPATYKPLGTITIREEKGKRYRWIKIKDEGRCQDRNIPYARYLWLKHKGPIPEGFLVVHADGDTLNDSVENLRLVDHSGHLRLQRKKYPQMERRRLKNCGRAQKRKAAANRKRRLAAEKEQAEIRRQEKIETEERQRVEQAIKGLEGQAIEWWECTGCGQDYGNEPPAICGKCNGFRFTRIRQKLRYVA